MRYTGNTLHPFGMLLVDRTWQSTATYKFGFNGKENVDDVYGNDAAVDFGARIYDGRLGRWLSIDKLYKLYPDFSPYISFANNPILFIDPDGKTFYISASNPEALILAKNDIYNLVPEQYQCRIRFITEGEIIRVEFNLAHDVCGPSVLTDDMGATLLSNLINADENYLYTVSDYSQTVNVNTGAVITHDISTGVYYSGEQVIYGVDNISKTKYSCDDNVEDNEYQIDNNYLKDRNCTSQPISVAGIDIDGNVVVAQTGRWFNPDATDKYRGDIVFFELWENYERTTNGKPHDFFIYNKYHRKEAYDTSRNGAHKMSVDAQRGRGSFDGTKGYLNSKDGNKYAGNAKYVK